MNLDYPFVCDIETVGLLPDLTEGQEEDFHVLGVSYFNGKEWAVKTTDKKEDVFKLFENPDNTIVGHNFYGFDLLALKKIFPDINIRATIIDSLLISYYIEPNRLVHGLEKYGEDFGVPKPEVSEEEWKGIGMTKEEHKSLMAHRVSEDVKINTKLWIHQLRKYRSIYDGDDEKIKSHINFINVKGKMYHDMYLNPLKIDVKKAEEHRDILQNKFDNLTSELSKVMPKIPSYVVRKKPKNLYKKDGTLSVSGERWEKVTSEHGVDLEYEGDLKELMSLEEPNPNSTQQVKDWLFSLGWKPELFKETVNKAGEKNKVPQLKDMDKNLCKSILKLEEKEPKVRLLEDLSVLGHRLSLVKGFLRDCDENGNIVAKMGGLANTLRIKHRTIVNLPSVSSQFGEYIRSLIVPQEGFKFIGSDISGLENQTKLNFIVDIDPEYVKEQNEPFFDPHLDIGLTAGYVNNNEVKFYKWLKEFRKNKEIKPDEVHGKDEGNFREYVKGVWVNKEEEFDRIDEIRQNMKTVNYSSTYNVGANTLSKTLGISKSEAQKMLDAYWDKNWSVKKFTDDQQEKTIGREMWVLNPINGYWYSLRSQHSKFSTLNQSAGDYIFTMWCYYMMQQGVKIQLGMHDEIITSSKLESYDKVTAIIKESMEKVNKVLKLKVPIGVDYAIGDSYADIH